MQINVDDLKFQDFGDSDTPEPPHTHLWTRAQIVCMTNRTIVPWSCSILYIYLLYEWLLRLPLSPYIYPIQWTWWLASLLNALSAYRAVSLFFCSFFVSIVYDMCFFSPKIFCFFLVFVLKIFDLKSHSSHDCIVTRRLLLCSIFMWFSFVKYCCCMDAVHWKQKHKFIIVFVFIEALWLLLLFYDSVDSGAYTRMFSKSNRGPKKTKTTDEEQWKQKEHNNHQRSHKYSNAI